MYTQKTTKKLKILIINVRYSSSNVYFTRTTFFLYKKNKNRDLPPPQKKKVNELNNLD